MGEATKTTNHSWSSVDGLRRSIDAGIGTQRQPEWGDGNSLPGVGDCPRQPALGIRSGGTALDLNGVSGGLGHHDEAKSRSAGESATRPNWETGERDGAAHTGAALPAITSATKALQPVPKVSHIGIKDGEIVAVIILLASYRLVERDDDDLASWATDTAPGGLGAGWVRCEIVCVTCLIGQVRSCQIGVMVVVHGALSRESAMTHTFVTEPALIPDTFATGLLPIERGDGWFRLTYYASKDDCTTPKSSVIEHTVVARIVLPSKCLFRAAAIARESIPGLRGAIVLDG